MVRELAKSYAGVDPVTEPIPVRPVVHYMMGGIHTDIATATPIAGLFAAGECACVSINGANRLGSNSLSEILVFGAIAGRSAAAFATGRATHQTAVAEALCAPAQARFTALVRREKGSESVARLRKELNHTMETGAGIYRTAASLEETCRKVADLRARYANVQLEDRSNVYNTNLLQALELGAMLDVAEAVVHSALNRREFTRLAPAARLRHTRR